MTNAITSDSHPIIPDVERQDLGNTAVGTMRGRVITWLITAKQMCFDFNKLITFVLLLVGSLNIGKGLTNSDARPLIIGLVMVGVGIGEATRHYFFPNANN
ncbi:MAG: hypothetical protein JHC93_06180 [Parachlamydiales bacterium]|nr:hypothetical protein [Parachlamydiales bacterium]